MTEKNHCCCEQLQNLKNSPEQCTTEQIQICHGDETTKHPCTCQQKKQEKSTL